MEHSNEDLEILKLIGTIKWGKDYKSYKCRKCGNTEYTLTKNPYETKCSNWKCKTIESPISNTAFADGKLSVSTKINILYKLQEAYPNRMADEEIASRLDIQKMTVHNFLNGLANWYPQKFDTGDTYENPDEDDLMIFVHGLPDESKDKYTSIYEIISYCYEIRPLKSMLEILVKKDSNYIIPTNDFNDSYR